MKSGSVQSVADLARSLVTAADRRRMAEDLGRALDLIPDHVTRISVSEWAEAKRILSDEVTATPGPFRWNVTPYLREIADCLSEASDVQEVAVMKGAQIGFTTGVLENWIGYIIDVCPGPAMMVDADKTAAEAGMEIRVDKMIESAGLSDKIAAQTRKKANKKTGDTKARKDFHGGFFMAVGPKVGARLRKFAIRYLSLDEIDAYQQTVGSDDGKTANEGDAVTLAIRRTATFEATRKILYGSTPLLEATSKIAPLFRQGDQRYYEVPCPHCGHFQRLRWRDEDGTFRLKFETDAEGNLVAESVYYECERCRGDWKNGDKWILLSLGRWVPTATPRRPRMRSYHISSLYSIKQSWEQICQQWIDAQGDQALLRTFVTTVLGETWIEKGEAPIGPKIWARREGYEAGTLPPTARPLFVTLGADVQKDRIEAELVAWGKDKESWSISYHLLPQEDITDLSGEAWKELAALIESTHAGLRAELAMIDSGYNSSAVYDFCEKYAFGVIPIKGDPALERERGLTSVYALRDVKGYGGHIKRADLNTTHLKLEFYNQVKRGTASGEAPDRPFPGYCHFPRDYSKEHYDHLTAEERLPRRLRTGRTAMVWEQHGRNEPLDCFDAETEVLTDQGWKRFAALNHHERLATVRLDMETIEYQKPVAYIEREHDGEMVQIHGRRIDILVTPKHRMVAIRRRQERQPDGSRKWNLDPKPEIVLAEDLTVHDQLLVAASWAGTDVRRVTIPAYVSRQGRVVWPEINVDAGDWAEFVGWFVSEGCALAGESKTQTKSVRRRVQLDQNEGPKADAIRAVLARLPWPFREGHARTSVRWICTSAQLYEAVTECGIGVANKRVPQWVKNSSPRIIARFMASAILGDGWKQGRPGQKECRTYATVSRRLADDVQELFIKLGKAANIREVTPKPIYGSHAFRIARGDLFGCARTQYHVSECHRRKVSLDGGGNDKREFLGQRVKYSGKVYCATVPNGTLILRRNGRSFIAGNCRAYALAAVYLLYGERLRELQEAADEDDEVVYTWSDFWAEWEAAAKGA